MGTIRKVGNFSKIFLLFSRNGPGVVKNDRYTKMAYSAERTLAISSVRLMASISIRSFYITFVSGSRFLILYSHLSAPSLFPR